jgi:hypothetical protein
MVRATRRPARAFDYALVRIGGNPTEQHDPADRFIDDLAFVVVRERLSQVFEAELRLIASMSFVPVVSAGTEPATLRQLPLRGPGHRPRSVRPG